MPTAESEMLRDDGNVDFSSRTWEEIVHNLGYPRIM
jgi:hypothetical protein